ncbi:sugar ABC transporter substrate-binding protein [Oceanobacillus sojae]|uniref:Maltose ABC transporter substrate-binding protein n=1 Tax=Oceanobacillus sojae TaxID=582851 RepID=A0A511ZJI1_9BACI|nr:extracellular solute-binding protein [Oceanobacillus sojae]GEN87587.1 maltose ABC transporter substrate-binding protein [Oceanobacillus sojae]
MKGKVRFLALISLLFILVLGACAPDREEPGEESAGGESEKPEELVIWMNDQDEQMDAINEIVEKYEEQEGISVKVEGRPMVDQLQQLSLAGPEGNGPDLFYQPHDQIGNIVAQGLAEPLDVTDDQLNRYVDAAVDAVTYTYDDETNIYGLPAVIETYGLFYNKSIIGEAPETMEDVLGLLEDHTDASNDEYGFLMRPNDFYFSYPFLVNYGGYIFGGEVGDYDVTDVGLANDGAIEGGEFYQEFFGSGKIPAATTADVIDGLFTEGKIGAVINGPWSIPVYESALGDDLAFAPFPQINGEPSSTFVGVKSWMVSYYSENKDWAQDLAMFITNEENQQTYYDIAGELPPNEEALNNIEDPMYADFAEQIQFGVPMPSAPEMAQVWEPMQNALQFLTEGEDAREVLEEAVDQINTNIQAGGGGN